MSSLAAHIDRHGSFRLDAGFLEGYERRPVQWGFGALSWVVYQRTYSRHGEDWWQTCRRVIEGTVTVQRTHCLSRGLAWDEARGRAFAEDAYDRMWRFKWTPPGRGLWLMGTRFVYERGGEALNSCGFVSTKEIAEDFARPFTWMFRMTMLGVGVGFDTRGRGTVTIRDPARGSDVHVVADSREGWAEALRRLLSAYDGRGTLPARWDTSRIRPRGAPLVGFGGTASGPQPLEKMLASLEQLYEANVGRTVDSEIIVDTMNLIARCVVVGGSRRAAQIAFGDPKDRRFCRLKSDEKKLREYRWASNNSVFATVGMDYGELVGLTASNGEPGFLWLDNARAFGRMKDPPSWADRPAAGSNPCVEQTLWDGELCCLVETYPARHASRADYLRTLRVAFLYAKTVTLIEAQDPKTNAIMQRNRRIGCSMTGIVQAINRHGYRRFMRWCDTAYGYVQRLDATTSAWLAIPRSIKTTSVKPSGTVSILAGATPGVHWEQAPHYIRRVRIADDHPLVGMCRQAGYPVEADAYAEATAVVSFPLRVRHVQRSKVEVSVREKVDLAAQMQHYWADNQVSCTADFDPERETSELPRLLSAYEDRLKALVFLPSRGHGYEQPPYETISSVRYEEMASKLRPLKGRLEHEHGLEARFCEGGVCSIE